MNINNGKTQPTSINRRKMLKAGLTAMPVVLTLQSGEALARSSNLIREATGSRDADGNALCLDTTYADPLGQSGKYDLGYDGTDVNVIPDVGYNRAGEDGSVPAEAVCNDGGYWEYDGGAKYVDLPTNGIVVSSVSLNSVGSRTTIFMRNWTDLS